MTFGWVAYPYGRYYFCFSLQQGFICRLKVYVPLKIGYGNWCFTEDCWGPSIMRGINFWCHLSNVARLTSLVLPSSNICSCSICAALSILRRHLSFLEDVWYYLCPENRFSGSQLYLLHRKVAFLKAWRELLCNISATMILKPGHFLHCRPVRCHGWLSHLINFNVSGHSFITACICTCLAAIVDLPQIS